MHYLMKERKNLLERAYEDLGVRKMFIKDQDMTIKNCWHFTTDGNAVDAMFYDQEDFKHGMNRIHTIWSNYDILILAFALMDTHIHFILYGEFDDCNRFIHEYVRRTSIYISNRYGERHKFNNIPIHHQVIDTDRYLKHAICYTLRNPPVGGINYTAWDYPWSSGPLMFRNPDTWAAPAWRFSQKEETFSKRKQMALMKTHQAEISPLQMIGEMIFPGEYVAFGLAEIVFRSVRSYNFFLCTTKESDIESRGGAISHLSLPIQELRQHKNEICMALFNVRDIRNLSTQQRLKLARTLKAKYNSSDKQILRLCGLIYSEAKNLL